MNIFFGSFLLAFNFISMSILITFLAGKKLKEDLFFTKRNILCMFLFMWIYFFLLYKVMTLFDASDTPEMIVSIIIIVFCCLILTYEFAIQPLILLFRNRNIQKVQSFDNWQKEKFKRTYNIYVLKSDEKNAYATGIIPFSMVILIGKPLMETMSNEQIKSIIAHEAGHLKNRHLIKLYLLSILVVSLLYIMSILYLLPVIEKLPYNVHILRAICWGIFYFLPNYYILGFFQRTFEYQADSYASKIMGKEQLIDALKKFDEISEGKVRKGGITHPPMKKRITHILRNSTMRCKPILALLFYFSFNGFANVSFSQQFSGNVTNISGEPIEGAHVYLKKTGIGTTTNSQGYFF